MNKKIQKKNTEEGVALLMAVLTVSILLAIGLTMLSFVIKQFSITSSSRESVNAIYAADAGIECALLWDIRGHEPPPDFFGALVFPATTNPDIGAGNTIMCSGTDISGWTVDYPAANTVVTTFELDFGTSCAIVEVTKLLVGIVENTSVRSNGYNVGCGTYDTDLNAVERTIKVDYIFS